MKGKLIILSAPSGAGKSTIINALLKKSLNLEFSISACNRGMRTGEVDKKDYYFISTKEFKNKILEDKFVEWEEVYEDHYYGTLKSEVERIINSGNNVIFDIDIVGGINIKELYKEDALAIFIMPPSVAELEKRLINRSTDKLEDIKKRVNKAEQEIKQSNKFDKIIINDNLENAINETYKAVSGFVN